MLGYVKLEMSVGYTWIIDSLSSNEVSL